MKRCATHVYVARFIYHAQQVSRHSMWSAALCRAPYNLNIPPVNAHDNEKLGPYVDVGRSTQQVHFLLLSNIIIVFHQEVVLIEKRNIELHKLHFTVYRQCCAADIELMSGRKRIFHKDTTLNILVLDHGWV